MTMYGDQLETGIGLYSSLNLVISTDYSGVLVNEHSNSDKYEYSDILEQNRSLLAENKRLRTRILIILVISVIVIFIAPIASKVIQNIALGEIYQSNDT